MPTIVADELDIPFENVIMEFAPAAPAYADAIFHIQITGGSVSTASSWMPLRTAGASARAMLVAAAAKQWGVDPSTLTTKAGTVIDSANNRTVTYGSLTGLAATMPMPDKPVLKTRDQFTLIGKVNKRIDTPLKVNGTAKYGIDVRVPGMKFASILYPPVFGATVKSFDATAAKKVHGVVDVVQVPSGIAVVATNSWSAFQGKAALKVVYENATFAHSSTATLKDQFVKLARSGAGRDSRSRNRFEDRFRKAARGAVFRPSGGARHDGAPERDRLRNERRRRNLGPDASPDDRPRQRRENRRRTARKGEGSHDVLGRRLRTAALRRLHERCGLGQQGDRGARPSDLDARRRHQARLV